jgi:hypothetical protein
MSEEEVLTYRGRDWVCEDEMTWKHGNMKISLWIVSLLDATPTPAGSRFLYNSWLLYNDGKLIADCSSLHAAMREAEEVQA